MSKMNIEQFALEYLCFCIMLLIYYLLYRKLYLKFKKLAIFSVSPRHLLPNSCALLYICLYVVDCTVIFYFNVQPMPYKVILCLRIANPPLYYFVLFKRIFLNRKSEFFFFKDKNFRNLAIENFIKNQFFSLI